MRHARMFAGILAGVCLIASIAQSCGGYGPSRISIKTHRNIRNAIVRDGQLYLLSDMGEVLSLDAGENLKSHGRLDIRPGSLFEVSGGKALIAVQSRVYIADLAKAGTVAVQVFEEPIVSLGTLDATRFFVVHKGQVQVLETANGKSAGSIAIGKGEKSERRAITAQVQGKLLYVFVADGEAKQSVLAVDWKTNRIENEYPLTGHFLGQIGREHVNLEITDDTILLGGVWYSYGIPVVSLAKIDLATKKMSVIAAPQGQLRMNLVRGNPQRLTIAGEHAVYQIDKAGSVGRALPKTNGSLLTMWRQNAVFAGDGTLDIVPLTEPAPVKSAQSN